MAGRRIAGAARAWLLPAKSSPARAALAITGGALGMFLWIVLAELGIQAVPLLRSSHPLIAGAILGAALGITRVRPLLWGLSVICGVLVLALSYSPFVVPRVRALVRVDPLHPVEAVVVLSSDIQKDGEMTPASQGRVLRGYEILAAGMARRMILPKVAEKGSYVPVVSAQMKRLGLDWPLEEVGPVRNTFEEATAVARLARERRWSEVILVTDPTHTRRAAAVFEKAGTRVICAPCADRDFDLSSLETPEERLRAFRTWIYEIIGYQTYRLRGWI